LSTCRSLHQNWKKAKKDEKLDWITGLSGSSCLKKRENSAQNTEYRIQNTGGTRKTGKEL
jgi:hypothetical protein